MDRKRLVLAVLSACIIFACSGIDADSGPSEYEVKAAYLYHFSKYVEWPSGSFTDAKSPIVIGIVGEDPFGSALDKAVKDERVNDRRIEIKRYKSPDDIQNCHILFVSQSEKRRLPKVFDRTRGQSILTVSDIDGFALHGGMIAFILESNKVRLQVNLENAQKEKLKISSKLLRLASVVKD